VVPSGELMLVGMENSVSLSLLSIPVDGQKWQSGLFSIHQGRKITPSIFMGEDLHRFVTMATNNLV